MKRPASENWVLLALVVAGVVCRVAFRGVPNFAPVAAIALFAGYYASSRWIAAAVPVAILAVSDLFLGGYAWQTMLAVYALLTLPTFVGHWLQASEGMYPSSTTAKLFRHGALLLGCSLAPSILFFVFSNLAWWASTSMYERTWTGLLQCYSQALPFFRNTLTGDLFFAAVLFGGYSLALALVKQSQANLVPETVRE